MNSINNREEKWRLLSDEVTRRGGNGDELVAAMKKLYSVYSSDMLIWLGGLFDTKIGGFYYSASAKNNEDYLPDIESTYQALVLLQRSGVISSYDCVPESIRRKIAGFICSLEDCDSGYFYHPQWSKSLTDEKISRKSRDLMWARALSSWLDFELPYLDACSRLKDSAGEKDGIFSSRKSFIEYLEGLDLNTNATAKLHKIASLADQITAAGLTDVALDFFSKNQNKETGFWQNETDITAVYSFATIASVYNSAFETKIPNAKKAAEAILSVFLCPEASYKVGNVSQVRNLWNSVNGIKINLNLFGDEDDRAYAEELSLRLLRSAPAAILDTANKIAEFKKPTGAFSWVHDESPVTSQGVPATPPKTRGGDVNATVIAVGTINHVYQTLGLGDYAVSLFEPEDFDKFVYSVDIG